MAGNDPGRIKEFEKLPILDYLIILDKKLAEAIAASRPKNTSAKTGKRAR